MSQEKDEVKKKREIEALEVERLDRERMQALRQQHRDTQAVDFELDLGDGSEKNQENRDNLIKLYTDFTGRAPEIDEETGKTHLHFDSQDQALDFFEKASKENIPFLAIEVDTAGKPTGNYYMSTGDGKLQTGNVGPDGVDKLKNDFFATMDSKSDTRMSPPKPL